MVVDEVADAAPHVERALLLGALARHRRPERVPPEAREKGRQEGEPREKHHGHPSARLGPSVWVALKSARVKTSIDAITVAPAERIAGRRPFGCAGHRLVLVLDQAKLLPVAGHDQEAVVGAGAEHQDDEERGRLAVHLDRPRLDQPVDRGGRDAVRERDDDQRDECDHRRAVDREQEDQDERHGHEQEHEVDGLEHLDRVRDDPGDACGVGAKLALPCVSRRRHVADRLDVRLDLFGVFGVGADEKERGRAVLGDRGGVPSGDLDFRRRPGLSQAG